MVGRILGLALLLAGLVMLYFGWQSTESLGEQLVEGVTGRYSDSTMAYLIGGLISAVVGLGLLLFSRR
ncbi:MAG: DUF3185 family protein [Xanthomonadales bacterium]|nr:DUF3185 family protein [Xanthomonadales bacterium]MCB1640518.1 DUF3185 family protein [Xanthomonadales bacterium]